MTPAIPQIIVDNAVNDCAICLEEVHTEDAFTSHPEQTTAAKAHIFHKACCDQWFNLQLENQQPFSCPLCKQEIAPVLLNQDILEFINQEDEFESNATKARLMLATAVIIAAATTLILAMIPKETMSDHAKMTARFFVAITTLPLAKHLIYK